MDLYIRMCYTKNLVQYDISKIQTAFLCHKLFKDKKNNNCILIEKYQWTKNKSNYDIHKTIASYFQFDMTKLRTINFNIFLYLKNIVFTRPLATNEEGRDIINYDFVGSLILVFNP